MKNLFYLLFVLPLLFSCGDDDSKASKADNKFDVSQFTPNKSFKFVSYTYIESDGYYTRDDDKRITTVTVLDNRTAKIHIQHINGYDGSGGFEEEGIYNYRIDEASNYKREYGDDELDAKGKVIILKNMVGRKEYDSYLEDRFLITNDYSEKAFVNVRMFYKRKPNEPYATDDFLFLAEMEK